jgi:RNA-directed DNA polymerase
MARIVEPANLRRAWKRVKANHGAPGVDGISVDEFPAFAREPWPEIRAALEAGTYQPQPVRRKAIAKPGGGERLLGIPCVVDRVIQQAILQVLTPLIDPTFSASSYGFRPGRSAHQAVKAVQQAICEGYRIAVDIDLAKFFDHVNFDVLMERLARHVHDRRLLALIGRYLRAGVLVGGVVQPTEIGVPQGGPLSALLSNVVLDEWDKELERRGHRFVRYADDALILVKSQRAGERVMASLTRFLDRQLKLPVNTAKSQVVPTDQCTFLGFTFKGSKIAWSAKSQQAFRQRVKELTRGAWGVSFARRIEQLNRFLRGWMNYFRLAEYYRPIPELEQWIRRRLRMCCWRHWKRPRTRIRKLLALGIPLKEAILTGRSSRGPWTMARTPVTQAAMSNAWFQQQGLLSLKDLWSAFHYPR